MRGKRNLMPYVLSLGVLVLVWKGAAVLVQSPVLVPPEEVFKNFLKACVTLDFWSNFGISTYRVVAGIALGWVLGFPVGVLLGYSVQTDRILAPLVFMTYPVPKIVLLPLILLFFGLGDLSKIVLITLIVFFQILVATRDGARAIDHKYFDSLRSLGAGDRVLVREVAVPASLPASITALRIGIGTAISVLFFVESFATTSGLGYLIMDAWARMDYTNIFVGIVGMGLLGVLLYEGLGVLESRVCAWQRVVRSAEETEAPLPERARKLALKTMVYGRMIKFSHTVFALPFAFAALLLAQREARITFGLVFWIVVAMIGARSAAMGFNRVVDAPLDARNPRTAGREIPAGALSRKEAVLFITGSSLVFVVASGFISLTCFLCSFVVLGLLFGYSYTKRFTWLSHIALGVVIGLAPLGVWVAVTDSLSARIAVLSFVLATYIAGFDILYACQDIEFDRREGLHSMPVRFGARASMRFSAVLHLLTFVSFLSVYWIFSLSHFFLAFAAAIGVLLVVEHRLVKPQDLTRIDVAFYHVNSVISVLIFLALVVEEVVRWLS